MLLRLFKYILVVSLLQSCYLQKDMIYLQDIDPKSDSTLLQLKNDKYRLQKNDILYISIKSDYQFESNILDLNQSNSGAFFNPTSLYLNGYSIDDNGFIKVPILGKIFVLNKTLEEVQNEIEIRANTIIKDAYVSVKLINFNISILGEVARPGSYKLEEGENSILKLIALAGDLTDYANRKEILLLRQENDKLKSYRIDLTNKQFILSENYFLQPNDVIYVESVKSKGFRIVASDYSVILTTITSTITAILLIINLQKL